MGLLSKRQFQVIKRLWEHPEGLSASDLVDEELKINTVQASLRALLKKEYIAIGKVDYRGTVLSRIYVPVISEEGYFCQILENVEKADQMMAADMVLSKISDVKKLEELEQLIIERRKVINKEHMVNSEC